MGKNRRGGKNFKKYKKRTDNNNNVKRELLVKDINYNKDVRRWQMLR